MAGFVQFGPQFGTPQPGLTHADRPSVFGLVLVDGRLACVGVDRGEASYFDLPGGAIDGDETETQALIREFREETGLSVRPEMRFAQAGQYFVRSTGEPLNNLCGFWTAERLSLLPETKVEADHELVWLAPVEALVRLRHDAHAWAVASWLRLSRD